MQSIIESEPIKSIQLHINSLNTFHNTLFTHLLATYSKPASIFFSLVQHPHPSHPLSQLPFAVVNYTHVVPLSRLLSLIEAISTHDAPALAAIHPIYSLCEELCEVGCLTSAENDRMNPYWLLLSPVKKMEMVGEIRRRKNNLLHENSRYLPTGKG